MSKLAKFIDKLYDSCFEKVEIKSTRSEENTKMYLPCNVLFGQFKKQREDERRFKNV